jgi:hypothetical protein
MSKDQERFGDRTIGEYVGSGTEQGFSSNFEHLEGDATGVVDPIVSFQSAFLKPFCSLSCSTGMP